MTPPRGVEDAAPYRDDPKTIPHTHARPRRPEVRPPYNLPLPQPVGEGFIPSVPLSVVLHLTIHSVGAAYMPPAPPGQHPLTSHPPVGAGHARPATSPLPAVNLSPPTHSPKPPNPATLLPPTPIICTPQPPSPPYTPCPNFPLKLCRKNQKNLQKPVDKGHTSCYNNQAVSRAQPAAAAAEAFTYSL